MGDMSEVVLRDLLIIFMCFSPVSAPTKKYGTGNRKNQYIQNMLWSKIGFLKQIIIFVLLFVFWFHMWVSEELLPSSSASSGHSRNCRGAALLLGVTGQTGR